MNRISCIIILVVLLCSCQSKQYDVNTYFNDNQRDTLLTNIITYVYVKAPGATNATRFKSEYRQFYTKSLPVFRIDKYYQAPDGWNYFFLIRPVGSSPNYKRGVLGKFKLTEGSLIPQAFEEIVNTPHLEEKILAERGGFLFNELVKKGNLNEYLAMKHYIEWPDATLVYDKKINEWVPPVQ